MDTFLKKDSSKNIHHRYGDENNLLNIELKFPAMRCTRDWAADFSIFPSECITATGNEAY